MTRARRRDVGPFLLVAVLATVVLLSGAAAAEDGEGADHEPPDPFGFTCTNSTVDYSTVSTEGPYSLENANVTVFSIPSKQDGEPIQIGLIRPDTTEEVPVIVRATPYTDDLRHDDVARCWGTERLAGNYVQHGYAVATVAVRGTGGSGGCMSVHGPAERRDLDRSVTYLGTRGWSNGNVGMSGMSYDGGTQWEVAGMGNPHLKTIVPMGSVTDHYSLMYRNGAVELRGPGYYHTLLYGLSLGTDGPATGARPGPYASRAGCPDTVARGYAAAEYSTATGERDPAGYWAERNLRPLVEDTYAGSVFLVHGLRDGNVDPSQVYPWIERLEADEDVRVRYMIGQWNHTYLDAERTPDGTRRTDWADVLLEWWDQELEGEDADLGPDAYVQDSTGEWRFGKTWPPADAREQTWYLQPNESLARDRTDETATYTVAVDPDRHGASPFAGDNPPGVPRPDVEVTPGCEVCARFETGRFDEPYRFAGAPDLNVTVTPTGPTGYLTATLYVVDAEGDATPVGWGMTDVRHGDRDGTADTVVPGQPREVSVGIEPLDVKVPAGSRLAVVLHQGTAARRSGSPPAPLRVHAGDGRSTFDVAHFEAPAQPGAAPDPSAQAGGGATAESRAVGSTAERRGKRIRGGDSTPDAGPAGYAVARARLTRG